MSVKKLPLISGVLPTFNREKYLPCVLDAFQRQTLPADEFELVIVDDGSNDSTASILSAYISKLPNMRIISQSNSGISIAKNRGVANCRAPIILFLDDDDAADERLFESHMSAHRRHPADNEAILGRTELAQDRPISIMMHYVTEIGCQLFSYPQLDQNYIYGHTEFWGGRTSCKMALLRDMAFDPIFRFGCEDIELGWRLRSRGLKVRYQPQAVTRMLRQLSLHDFCERSRQQGKAQAMFAHLYSESAEVTSYCEVDKAFEAETSLTKSYPELYRRTEKLEAAAILSKLYSGTLERELETALYGCYDELFKCSRYGGFLSEAKNIRLRGTQGDRLRPPSAQKPIRDIWLRLIGHGDACEHDADQTNADP